MELFSRSSRAQVICRTFRCAVMIPSCRVAVPTRWSKLLTFPNNRGGGPLRGTSAGDEGRLRSCQDVVAQRRNVHGLTFFSASRYDLPIEPVLLSGQRVPRCLHALEALV